MVQLCTTFALKWPDGIRFINHQLEPRAETRHKLGKNEAIRLNVRDQVGTSTRQCTVAGQFERERAVIIRLTGAAMRGFLVALMVATPALMLPNVSADSAQITVLIALLGAFLVFVEYNSVSPSIVEFRQAPPMNRLRFCGLSAMILLLTAMFAGKTEPTALTGAITSIGRLVGGAMDFPFSPVRLMVLAMPADAAAPSLRAVRDAAGVSYLIGLIMMAVFVLAVRLFGWPSSRSGPFNVWINLPMFDPTAGADVLVRLQRDSRINIVVGALMPFALPAVAKLAGEVIGPMALEQPQTLIWIVSLWAFLPASLVMRGIAMGKVADMIQQKRRRNYASQAEERFQAA